ncbi:MAG: hypothetical protein R3338_10010 [Thermoanaerobaculia bacterium]|nr:hypothetical protein [Thermoanaerobaculia bacterium]
MRFLTIVLLFGALAASMLLHAHASADASSVHCSLCIQQNHVVVAEMVTIIGDERVRDVDVPVTSVPADAPSPDAASPRAPPA